MCGFALKDLNPWVWITRFGFCFCFFDYFANFQMIDIFSEIDIRYFDSMSLDVWAFNFLENRIVKMCTLHLRHSCTFECLNRSISGIMSLKIPVLLFFHFLMDSGIFEPLNFESLNLTWNVRVWISENVGFGNVRAFGFLQCPWA